MKEIRLKVRNNRDYKLLLDLANRLGVDYTEHELRGEEVKEASKAMADILDQWAEEGGSSIEDPIDWQNKTRKDRNIL